MDDPSLSKKSNMINILPHYCNFILDPLIKEKKIIIDKKSEYVKINKVFIRKQKLKKI